MLLHCLYKKTGKEGRETTCAPMRKRHLRFVEMKLVHIGLLVSLLVLLGALTVLGSVPQKTGDYYSLTERRMPCGRILRREVLQENDAWRKTVTLLDATGRVLETQTRTVEPEQCTRIQAGKFVPGLWRDCTVQI